MKQMAIQGDEEIVLTLRPSAWFILLYPVRMIIVVNILAALLSLVAATFDTFGIVSPFMQPWWITIWLLSAAVSLVLISWSILEWRCRLYVLTTRRVLTFSGVVRRTRFETSLIHLRQTLVHVSIGERCVGIGSLLFATAGTAFYDTSWTMLSDPVDAQRKVQNLSRRSERS